MEIVPDDYRLEAIAEQHEIAAGIFVPFTIARLLDDPDATEIVSLLHAG